MTNSVNCFNQQPPSYSGVTINITNPALNMSPVTNPVNGAQCTCQNCVASSVPLQAYQYQMPPDRLNTGMNPVYQYNMIPPAITSSDNQIPNSYPPQYYMNGYDNSFDKPMNNISNNIEPNIPPEGFSQAQLLPNSANEYDTAEPDNETSKAIIEGLEARQAEQKELENTTKMAKVVALTDEYIISLENYLNNPNADIRLMAAKEILTRLDEDRSRYDDAALNALLNKMLQDPNKLVRIAALSALSSDLASGNDYTIELLTEIQRNPFSDSEDVLEASQILLKRTAIEEEK